MSVCYFYYPIIHNAWRLTDDTRISVLDHLDNGVYAYLAYRGPENTIIFALRELQNFQSEHGGLHLFAQSKLRLHPNTFFLPELKPLFGGELIWLENHVQFWDFQSSGYSKEHAQYHDEYAQWEKAVLICGFSPSGFYSIKQAELYKQAFFPMRYGSQKIDNSISLYFGPNGRLNLSISPDDLIRELRQITGSPRGCSIPTHRDSVTVALSGF